jgi:glycosyltransferase involved in cell wall biosynthesis
MSKKVLFIAPHRFDRSPSQRFRFEQYFNYLESNGFKCKLSFLLSEKDDKVFYSPGNVLIKAIIFFKCFFKRFSDVITAYKYDMIFIQREAFFIGYAFFEKLFKLQGAKIIFDFDDAIWNFDISEGNKMFSFLKSPQKTSEIIKMSDMIFAGNPFLAEYALNYNREVCIVPTTIDMLKYNNAKRQKKDKICIGWSGSLTTIIHFKYAEDTLKEIVEKYKKNVYVKLIGYKGYKNKSFDVIAQDWIKDTEVQDLSEIDIGIMPLPNDKWSKGKCGLKGLQYMALGIPTIMSPVGVNNQIVEHGENGFLADSKEEWINVLSMLIESEPLRMKIGEKARETVINKYSVEANKYLYLEAFNEISQ